MTGMVFECFVLFLAKLLAYHRAPTQIGEFIPVD